MKFLSRHGDLPSKPELLKRFSVFGKINASRTDVNQEESSGKIVFLQSIDAVRAYQFARSRKFTLGRSKVMYQLDPFEGGNELNKVPVAQTPQKSVLSPRACLKNHGSHYQTERNPKSFFLGPPLIAPPIHLSLSWRFISKDGEKKFGQNDEDTQTGDTQQAEYKTVVFWDINRCPLPAVSDCRIGGRIDSALMKLGYTGPLTAIGDLDGIPIQVLRVLSSGIGFKHLGQGIWKHCERFYVWGRFNEQELTIMVISDSLGLSCLDYVFAMLQKKRSGNKYNILVAYKLPLPKHAMEISAEWRWDFLLKQDLVTPDTKQGTRRQVLQDPLCFCQLCKFPCQSFEIFTTHLKGTEHALTKEEKCKKV
ncbi:unnamed protein product [Arabis nemorensis]|uniref:RRM domain-containing protein n=1 Tax=Arabis nemorensis TaxID=586526 RepID=A0A565AYB1_9BRAS|nr:unnamed protein product [Arabis nemorensis]